MQTYFLVNRGCLVYMFSLHFLRGKFFGRFGRMFVKPEPYLEPSQASIFAKIVNGFQLFS